MAFKLYLQIQNLHLWVISGSGGVGWPVSVGLGAELRGAVESSGTGPLAPSSQSDLSRMADTFPSLQLLCYVLHLERVNPFPHKDTFWSPWETSLLKTLWEKEKLLVTSKFLLFPQCFLPVWITFCHFLQIWNCRLQSLSIPKSLKFVIW